MSKRKQQPEQEPKPDPLAGWNIIYGQISWPELRDRMSVLGCWREFADWMYGQTCTSFGAYEGDVRAFLEGRRPFD